MLPKSYLLVILVLSIGYRASAQPQKALLLKMNAVHKGNDVFWNCILTEDSVSNIQEQYPIAGQSPKILQITNFHSGFNPAQFKSPLDINFDLTDFRELSVYSVFQPIYPVIEQALWTLGQRDTTRLILTTKRFADLGLMHYWNFIQGPATTPKVHEYFHNMVDAAIRYPIDRFLVGQPLTDMDPRIDLTDYQGTLSEILIYNRVLNPIEQHQVNSYLAIKYGIPLDQAIPQHYINGKGEVIWDAKQNRNFNHNIFVLGRDDLLQLYQRQAHCSLSSGILTVGIDTVVSTNHLNPSIIPDNAFLTWSDNLEDLSFEQGSGDKLPQLKRTWAVNRFGSASELRTQLQFRTTHLESDLPDGLIYWLIIDRSGTGSFAADNTLYVPMDTLLTDQFRLDFRNVVWDQDHSGRDVFSLAMGPAFFALYSIKPAQCQPAIPGTFKGRMMGGSLPITLHLQHPDGRQTKRLMKDSNSFAFEGLLSGRYRLSATDRKGSKIEKTIYIEGQDAPRIELPSSFVIDESEVLDLDLGAWSVSRDLRFNWQGPRNWISEGPSVRIESPGNYTLQTSDGDCLSRTNFLVESGKNEPKAELHIFPNPTSVGAINIKMRIQEVAPAELRITTLNGVSVLSKYFHGNDFYFFQFTPPQAGIFLVYLRTMGDLTIKKIIVQ